MRGVVPGGGATWSQACPDVCIEKVKEMSPFSASRE